MASDPTIIKTSIEILMKPDQSCAECPEETRCQLELVSKAEEDTPSLELENTEDELVKNLSVFLTRENGRCDYQLNVGMLGGVPNEYVLIRNNVSGCQVHALYDIAAQSLLNIDDYVSRAGSPAKPAREFALFSQYDTYNATGDTQWAAWVAWFDYNFNISENTVYSYSYTTTIEQGTMCAAAGYVNDASYDSVNTTTYPTKPYTRHYAGKLICTADADSYVEEVYSNIMDDSPPYYNTGGVFYRNYTDVRNKFFDFTLNDTVTTETLNCNIIATYNRTHELITGWSAPEWWAETSMEFTMFVDGDELGGEALSYRATDADLGRGYGEGGFVWPLTDTGQEPWDYQGVVGEVYTCTLGGCAYGVRIVPEDYDRWQIVEADSYYSSPSIVWPYNTVTYTYYVGEMHARWFVIPTISLVAPMAVYSGDKLSIKEAIDNRIDAHLEPMQSIFSDYLEMLKEVATSYYDVYRSHLNVNVDTVVRRAPEVVMYKAQVI